MVYICTTGYKKTQVKGEQALNLLENNFDVLKNNKQTLQHDPDLKIRVELLKRRMDDLLVSINE